MAKLKAITNNTTTNTTTAARRANRGNRSTNYNKRRGDNASENTSKQQATTETSAKRQRAVRQKTLAGGSVPVSQGYRNRHRHLIPIPTKKQLERISKIDQTTHKKETKRRREDNTSNKTRPRPRRQQAHAWDPRPTNPSKTATEAELGHTCKRTGGYPPEIAKTGTRRHREDRKTRTGFEIAKWKQAKSIVADPPRAAPTRSGSPRKTRRQAARPQDTVQTEAD